MQRVFIGRQPIFDAAGGLYGYELLYRGGQHDAALIGVGEGDRESSDVLLNSVLDIGLDQLTGGHRSFINVTRNLLLNDALYALPPDRIVLEVLETVAVDAELLERLRTLRRRRFEIALDDYVLTPERDALIDYAHVVKLDVTALDAAELERHVSVFKQRRRPIKLLAEKVETRAMYQQLLAMGFDLFQGYFFARPDVYTGRKLRPDRLAVLELLALINQPRLDIADLSDVIRRDVSMSVTMLRWANSALAGVTREVESIERAIVVVGLQTIQNWITLLAMSQLGATPTELLTTVLVRAKTCELMAGALHRANPGSYFTVGLLSALDVMLEMEMEAALERIPLSGELKAALHDRSGDHGAALATVIAMEQGEVEAIRFGDLGPEEAGQHYLRAIRWADQQIPARS